MRRLAMLMLVAMFAMGCSSSDGSEVAPAKAACAADDMPTERVQELTNTFAVRFLDSVFGDGEMITVADVAGIEDIIYETK